MALYFGYECPQCTEQFQVEALKAMTNNIFCPHCGTFIKIERKWHGTETATPPAGK